LRYELRPQILHAFVGPKQNMVRDKRRNTMRENRRITGTMLLLATLIVSLFFAGAALAQTDSPTYVGKFTLTQPTHWGMSVLKPGTYTVSINSTVAPIVGVIRNADGDTICFVVSQASDAKTNGLNALLIKEKSGQPTVHSLALTELGRVLIYDPSLANERPQEARVSRTVPVMMAKK